MTLTVWEYWSGILWNVPIWICLMIFLWFRLGLGCFGRKTTQVKCYPHHIRSKVCTITTYRRRHWPFLDHLLRQCFSGLPISGLYSLEGRVHNPSQRSREFHCTSRAAVPFSSQSPTPCHQAQTISPPRHLSSSCSACPSPSHGLALAFLSQQGLHDFLLSCHLTLYPAKTSLHWLPS